MATGPNGVNGQNQPSAADKAKFQAAHAAHEKEEQAFIANEVKSGKTEAQAKADWKAQHPHHKHSEAQPAQQPPSIFTQGQQQPPAST